jgi:hypothetical protein
MRHPNIATLIVCALTACGEDVSLGTRGGAPDGGEPDGGAYCTVEVGTDLDTPCGNVMCNGATQYCSAGTWPEPCKPLPCECASVPPSQQSCACLLQYITPDCSAGATCTSGPSGLAVTCNDARR